MHRFILLTVLSSFLLIGGCSGVIPNKRLNVVDIFNAHLFKLFGESFFQSIPSVSLKRIHLESSHLIGAKVVLSGEVVQISSNETSFVLMDSEARMLVSLVFIDRPDFDQINDNSGLVKVLGVIESGKMGLPFIVATAIYSHDDSQVDRS